MSICEINLDYYHQGNGHFSGRITKFHQQWQVQKLHERTPWEEQHRQMGHISQQTWNCTTISAVMCLR